MAAAVARPARAEGEPAAARSPLRRVGDDDLLRLRHECPALARRELPFELVVVPVELHRSGAEIRAEVGAIRVEVGAIRG